MADKFLNMALSSGIVTPLKISDVATIVAGADVGAGNTLQVQFTVTYANGGVATLLSQARGAANAVFIPSTTAQKTSFIRGLWEQIIEGVSTPWNLPVLPNPSDSWDMTSSPAASVVPAAGARSYISQSANPAGSASFASKQSVALLGTGSTAGALGIQAVSPFLSIA
tara:strand:- start:47 stop:550 length:504 start_codon:yes stop_codon:yes gene_type:complete